jgi:hypothetical protein
VAGAAAVPSLMVIFGILDLLGVTDFRQKGLKLIKKGKKL